MYLQYGQSSRAIIDHQFKALSSWSQNMVTDQMIQDRTLSSLTWSSYDVAKPSIDILYKSHWYIDVDVDEIYVGYEEKK